MSTLTRPLAWILAAAGAVLFAAVALWPVSTQATVATVVYPSTFRDGSLVAPVTYTADGRQTWDVIPGNYRAMEQIVVNVNADGTVNTGHTWWLIVLVIAAGAAAGLAVLPVKRELTWRTPEAPASRQPALH